MRRLWAAILALAAAGAAVSAYLTAVHWRPGALACGPAGGCHAIQASPYATLGGVPIALLGLGMYAAVAALAGAALTRRGPVPPPYLLLVVFGLSLAGTLYAAWLTWVEVAVLRAVCPWCAASAALVTAIAGAAGLGVTRQVVPGRRPRGPGRGDGAGTSGAGVSGTAGGRPGRGRG